MTLQKKALVMRRQNGIPGQEQIMYIVFRGENSGTGLLYGKKNLSRKFAIAKLI